MTLIVLIIAAMLAGNYVVTRQKRAAQYRTGLMYERFARQNQLQYTFRSDTVPDRGAIFDVGDDPMRLHVVGNEEFEFGNYTYHKGSGNRRRDYSWGYIAVALDREMPHMLLDTKQNNSTLFGQEVSSNLPSAHDMSQLLQLEGDFSKHFNLYVPKGYEADALYVFTPDLMARLIDHGSDCDIEVVGDRLYVYLPKMFDQSTAQVDYVATLLDALLVKFRDRTTRYLAHDSTARAAAAPALRRAPSYMVLGAIVLGAMLWLSMALGS